MALETLFPDLPGLELQNISKTEDSFFVHLGISFKKTFCPGCHQECSRIHSKYYRRITDLPWAGHAVIIHLQARKLFCDHSNCERKVFTERLGQELPPYARRTKRLNGQLIAIGFATGGNLGAELSKILGIFISPSTILRILHRTPDAGFDTPKVLGVDDWAFRKGNTYGTILVDLEKRKPIDLLPDREASTLEAWLKDHPGVEIISRDRASAYALGAKSGAPDAIHVADRWHLLKNLGDAMKRMLDKHNKELREAAKDIARKKRNQEIERHKIEKEKEKPKEKTSNIIANEGEALSKFHLNFLEVKKLKKDGHSIRSIRRQTGIHRQTIKKYLKYEEYPEKDISISKTSLALPFESYLRKKWSEGQTNHKQLWREIKEQGFTGSSQSVYRLVSKYPKDPSTENLPPPLEVKTWSAKKVSLLLSKPFEDLNEEKQNYLRAFYKRCPEANKASQLARKFKGITNKLKKKQLDPWINKALESGIPAIKNFAKGLQQDYDAVKAAVSLKWSNGQVEGQVNRLKTIKRIMYGRASFRLLRKRVLMDSS